MKKWNSRWRSNKLKGLVTYDTVHKRKDDVYKFLIKIMPNLLTIQQNYLKNDYMSLIHYWVLKMSKILNKVIVGESSKWEAGTN